MINLKPIDIVKRSIYLRLSVCLLLVFSASYVSAQDFTADQKAVVKMMTADICKCLEDFDAKGKSTQDLQTKMMQCSQEAGMKRTMELVSAFGAEKVQAPNFGATLGIEIQKQLLNDCPHFVKITQDMGAQSMMGGGASVESGVTAKVMGRAQAPEQDGFVKIPVKSEDGSTAILYLMRKFDGAEALTADLASVKGKYVEFEYREVEVYLPSAKKFVKVKEIVGVKMD